MGSSGATSRFGAPWALFVPLWTALLLVTAAGPARAQEQDARLSFGIGAGYGALRGPGTDEAGSAVELAAAYTEAAGEHLMLGLRAELWSLFASNTLGTTESLSYIAGTLNVQAELARPGSRLVPYLVAGGGLAGFSGTSADDVGGIIQAGGGVLIHPTESLEEEDAPNFFIAPQLLWFHDFTEFPKNDGIRGTLWVGLAF